MNLINWNCRGLGALRVVREVARLVAKFNPQLLFLIETKRKRTKMEWLRVRWKFDKCMAVDNKGRRGGLALLWNNAVTIEVQSFSNNHIDVLVGEIED